MVLAIIYLQILKRTSQDTQPSGPESTPGLPEYEEDYHLSFRFTQRLYNPNITRSSGKN
jgi:hypothetical protein